MNTYTEGYFHYLFIIFFSGNFSFKGTGVLHVTVLCLILRICRKWWKQLQLLYIHNITQGIYYLLLSEKYFTRGHSLPWRWSVAWCLPPSIYWVWMLTFELSLLLNWVDKTAVRKTAVYTAGCQFLCYPRGILTFILSLET